MPSHSILRDLCESVYHTCDDEIAGIEYTIVGNVVCFRGTDEWSDWTTNVRFLPVYRRKLGWCPAGFLKVSQKVSIKILCEIAKAKMPISELVLTGHSLGGAVAMLMGAHLTKSGVPPKEIVTFGAPKCGRLKLLDDVDVTQYRNGVDIVPKTPPLMRRHKAPIRGGISEGRIKDHSIVNYKDCIKEE